MLHLEQGSANCGPRARNFFKWNAARERKFCGPRACKCGPQSKNIFKLISFFGILIYFINFVLSLCIKFKNNLKTLLF